VRHFFSRSIITDLMTVTALLFASYAESLGTSSVRLSLAAGATVRDALQAVLALPGGDRLPRAPLVAVNQEYARLDQPLRGGEEVAIIPPVAGG
jgi:molybdopterin converting factor subunit 1